MENDLISRSALGIGRCNPEVLRTGSYASGWNAAIALIEAAPAVDAIVPPVKVGQVIWAELTPWKPGPDIQPFQVTNLVITQNKKGEWTKKFGAYWYNKGRTHALGFDFKFDDAGKKFFYTKEDAEKTLLPKRETVFTHGGWPEDLDL